jgi:hypothetical protein
MPGRIAGRHHGGKTASMKLTVPFALVALVLVAACGTKLPPASPSHLNTPNYQIRVSPEEAKAATITAETLAPVTIYALPAGIADAACLSANESDADLQEGTAAVIGPNERVRVVPSSLSPTPNADSIGTHFNGLRGDFWVVVTDDGYEGAVCGQEGKSLVVIPRSTAVE